MNYRRHVYFLTLAATGCLFASPSMAQNPADTRSPARSEVVQSCQACHGADGNSEVPSTPRLNGQQAEYMVGRLKTFTKAAQNNPHLKLGMFKDLSSRNNVARVSAAKYFSEYPATNPKPGMRAAEGKQIYDKGLASENVIACSQCHGARGEGHDAVPRIAGQHADYLMAQLQLFNMKFRKHVLMNPNTITMTGNTMKALTAYLAND